MQQLLGQFLVLRDRFGNRAGAVDFGGLDLALAAAPAKHHQAAIGQAAVGNIAHHGGLHDGAGRWAQTHVFIEVAQFEQSGGQVERGVGGGGGAQLRRQFHRTASDRFF